MKTEAIHAVNVVAGVDLGGTAINYTLIDRDNRFLIEGLLEQPALSKEGPVSVLPRHVEARTGRHGRGMACARHKTRARRSH